MLTKQRCSTAAATALVLGFFPSWLASESDWPKQLRLVGFPLTDQAAGGYAPDAAAALEQLPPALREFIMSSAKNNVPVYAFTAGSAPPPYAAAFFATAVEACRLCGARCVLLCGVASLVPQPLPAHACHAAYAPFSALLQHVSVLTFNGGIGAVSQALRAGTPMVRKRVHMSAAARRREHALTPSAARFDSSSCRGGSTSRTTRRAWCVSASGRCWT